MAHVPGAENAAGPDVKLFALIAAARDLDERWKAATDAASEAMWRTEVPWPEALIVTEDDTRLWKLNAGDPFAESHLDLLRRRQAHRHSSKRARLRQTPATYRLAGAQRRHRLIGRS